MGKEIFQAIVVFIMAIPFIYMAVDVFIDISKQIYKGYRLKLKPAVINIFTMINR